MKKVILLILLLTVVTSTFSACGDTPATESSSESATNKVVAITTTTFEKKSETSSLSTETESVSVTTPSVSEKQSKTETTVEPVNEKKLNLDLLSDIGLTYREIMAKRGERISVFTEGGGFRYQFKNGYGLYGWLISAVYEEGNWPKDENGDWIGIDDLPSPSENNKCESIIEIKPEYLFLGMTKSMAASEIGEIYGIKYVETQSADGWNGWGFVSIFSYKDIEINIYTNEKEKIDLDSEVNLFLNDQ